MDSDISALLSNFSTQLRSSLMSLHIAAQRLASKEDRANDPDLDDKAADFDKSYYQILRLVNNLSAFQSPERFGEQSNYDIAKLVFDTYQEVDSLSWYQNLDLRLICPMEHFICRFSWNGVHQVLLQLLSNAFKFTPVGGSITIELAHTNGQIQLSVTDTGPGISPEKRDAIYQLWQSERMFFSPYGPGLGLAICQNIAKQHDGVLTLDEDYTEGSRFVFSFPNRKSNTIYIKDFRQQFASSFDPYLIALSESLPKEAYRIY